MWNNNVDCRRLYMYFIFRDNIALINMCVCHLYSNIFIDIVRLAHFCDIKQTQKAKGIEKNSKRKRNISSAYPSNFTIIIMLIHSSASNCSKIWMEAQRVKEKGCEKEQEKEKKCHQNRHEPIFFRYHTFYGCVRTFVPGWCVLRLLVS